MSESYNVRIAKHPHRDKALIRSLHRLVPLKLSRRLLFSAAILPNGTWTQRGITIYGENYMDISGFSVSRSSDGNTVAVGAIEDIVRFWESVCSKCV